MYATVADVKAGSDSKDDKWDGVISRLLSSAEEVVNQFCNRPYGFVALGTPSAKLFAGTNKAFLYIGDCISISSVEKVDGSTLTQWVGFSGDYVRPSYELPYQGILLGKGVFEMELATTQYQVVARWGYAETVPNVVRDATIAQTSRWLKRGQGNWADTTANAEAGMLLYKQPLDPDIKMMLVNARLVKPAI
jgi:hypothetical protein